MLFVQKEFRQLCGALNSGNETEIGHAAVQLLQRVDEVVELPPKQVAFIIRALIDCQDAIPCNSDVIHDVFAALDAIIPKVETKYQIMYPKDVSNSNEFLIGVLERDEFSNDG